MMMVMVLKTHTNYDDKYSNYPPKENKKYTCRDSGLVVDKKENCPVICPTGSTLEGHFVKAGSDLTKICNVEAGTSQTCGPGTDLEGVLVTNPITDCDLTLDNVEEETCPTGTALVGVAVPDDGDPTTVPDVCNLAGLDKCISGDLTGAFVTDTDGNTFFDTTLPDTQEPICDFPEAEVEICASTTDLSGMVVADTNDNPNGQEAACEITLSDVELETCPAGTALVGVAVPDDGNPTTFPAVCNLSGLDKCISGDLTGAFVTDTDGNTFFDTTLPDTQEPICDLPEAEVEICASTTDLSGMVVADTNDNPNGQEAACEISLDDVELETCPTGTALAGVAVPDDGNPTTFPAVCNLSGLDKCISGDLTGAFVTDTDGNTFFDTTLPDTQEPICDLPEAEVEICASTTDLSGMVVADTNDNPNGQEAACEISLDDVELETCPAGTALVGVAVPDDGNPTTFPAVCNLSGLDKCISGDLTGAFVTDTDGNTFFDTTLPDTQEPICDLPEAEVEICASTTDLAGMVVADTNDNPNGQEAACEISLDDVELEICPAGTALAGVAVPDNGDPTTAPAACNAPGLVTRCTTGPLTGAFVTDPRLCNAATPAVQCGSTTDLFGVWVDPNRSQSLTLSCNISANDIVTNTGAQCLKCADLAIHFGGNNAEGW